jgi:zinc transport system substrate-binding protein
MKIWFILALLMLIFSVCGCMSQKVDSEQVKVATTIIPLGEFVREIGDERVKVNVLVPPGAEPHTFEPSPSQIRQIADANVYVENGAGFEYWIDNIIRINPSMLIVDISQGVDLIKGSDEGLSGRVDPHIWVSPRDAMIQVRNICDGLIKVDPSGKDYYIKNMRTYIRKLEELDYFLNSTFAKTEKKKFIVLHPAWSYFARNYGLEEISINEEEKEPGPKYVADVIELAKANGIKTIFVEPQYNPKMADRMANEIGGKVVIIDPLAENYIENMKHIGETIAQSLKTE